MINVIIAVKHFTWEKRVLKIVDSGPYFVEFPAMQIMVLWGMLFHPANDSSLGFGLLFRSCSAPCAVRWVFFINEGYVKVCVYAPRPESVVLYWKRLTLRQNECPPSSYNSSKSFGFMCKSKKATLYINSLLYHCSLYLLSFLNICQRLL